MSVVPAHSTRMLSTHLALIICTFLFCVSVQAQQQENPPKADLFAGYQWLSPGGSIPEPGVTDASGNFIGNKLPAMSQGFGLAFAYNFHPNFALEADYGGDWKSGFNINTVSIGPRVTWRGEGLNLFAHTLIGLNHLNTPFGGHHGIGAVLGGGMDLPINKYFNIRIFEADYQWARQNFANFVPIDQPGLRRVGFEGVRLRGGVVFNFGGGAPPVAPAAACSAQPTEVLVGEPVTINSTVNNFNPKHTIAYNWTSTGGKITGKENTASIDTNGVAGGNYTATLRATDPKAKTNNEANCSANFTVKEPPKNPPTMSCTATPTSLQANATATVTCDCKSPDNVEVSVAGFNASSGTISGTGNTATLNTAGAAAGPITVNATCTDKRGLTSTAQAQVTVEAPPQPSAEVQQLEARLALHSVYFPTGQPAPSNPKGGLLPSQQQTLTSLASDFQKYLQSKPDAHLILEGHADPRGGAQYNQALSERRVERVKGFLVEQGVPEANIDTKALGDQHNLTPDAVKASVESNPDITPGERQRILKNSRTIILASNRRVDITLSTTGQTSVRQFPFNAADSLSLIGGREVAGKKPVTKKKPTTKKSPTKKP
jgi:outer membrane protein OmpA-like peptidoglycan-associated protein